MGKFMVGCISYLPDTLDNCQVRCDIHKKQLEWLETLTAEFPFYQVESDWGETAHRTCQTTLEVNHIVTGANPPGYNRNLLLQGLYASDYDWLVCLDDDRCFYQMYDADRIFNDLETPAFHRLASEGYLMLSLDPMVAPFKKTNYGWDHHETHWYIMKGSPNGFMQISFIPNLVKFGWSPIYFDGETKCTLDCVPEDVEFQLKWLLSRHPIIQNRNLIMNEIGQSNGNKSVIFPTVDYRRQCEKSHSAWETTYLKEKLPRNPNLWKKSALNRARNPQFTRLVPRSVPYVFTGRDLPKGVGDE